MKNIIISGGGTGGHLFPALALGDSLKLKGFNLSNPFYYVMCKIMENN